LQHIRHLQNALSVFKTVKHNLELKSKYHLIIPASGIGSRFGSGTSKKPIPKQYTLMANGKTILDNTIEVFLENGNFDKFVIALNPKDEFFKDSIFSNHPKITTVLGGDERFLSVKNAVDYLAKKVANNDFIAVHDSVRPCVKNADINNLLVKIDSHKVGGLLGVPVFDTLKSYKNNQIKTIDRSDIYNALTPQIYRCEILKNALNFVIKNNIKITDDASSIEEFGEVGLMIDGDKLNIKITTKDDLRLANLILNNYE
jgi:2-C-methyl-D-erythritol 4-phosphate cytidylyltransferase